MTPTLQLFAVFAVAAVARGTGYAQDYTTVPGPVRKGTVVPPICRVGEFFIKTDAPAGESTYACTAENVFVKQGGGGAAGVPSGSYIFVLSGACPAGFTEDAALAGKTLFGTLAANKDAGTAGGSDTITPAGTNTAPALTMNSYTPAGTNGTAAYTPAGTNATSTVTPLGTVAAPVVSWPAGVPAFTGTPGAMAAHTISWPAGVPTFAGAALATHAHELPWQIPSTTTIRQIAVATFGTGTSRAATAVSAAGTANTTSAAVALSQGVGAGTPAGTIAWPAGVPTENTPNFTPVGTVAWPAGVPTNTAPAFTGSVSTVGAQVFTGTPGTVPAQAFTGTPATLTGSVAAPAFAGTQFDNRSAFVKVIFCRAD